MLRLCSLVKITLGDGSKPYAGCALDCTRVSSGVPHLKEGVTSEHNSSFSNQRHSHRMNYSALPRPCFIPLQLSTKQPVLPGNKRKPPGATTEQSKQGRIIASCGGLFGPLNACKGNQSATIWMDFTHFTEHAGPVDSWTNHTNGF